MTCWYESFLEMKNGNSYHPGIKATVDRTTLRILFRQGLTATRNNDLRKLRRALQNKRHGMLSKGVLLLYDNTRPHTSRTARELLKYFGWEVLDHAPYSPDLAPSGFSLLRYLKHSLGEKRFSDNEEVKLVVNSWLSDQVADLFERGFKTKF
ncbi:mariner Mos1 transposase [Trichonephila clavipes]|nr:mariner Mos1 transposase [Trichonephila clavipes]